MFKTILKWLVIISLLVIFFFFSPGLSLYSWAPFAWVWVRLLTIGFVLALLFRKQVSQLFTVLINAIRFAHESIHKRRQSYFKLYGEALGVIDADLAAGANKPLFLLFSDSDNPEGEQKSDQAHPLILDSIINGQISDIKDQQGRTVVSWGSNDDAIYCTIYPHTQQDGLWDILLRRLKGYRHAQPIHGLLVLKSIADLQQKSAGGGAFAGVSGVIEEIERRFRYALPTYCFCQDDGSLGLHHYAEQLPAAREQNQPFGFYFSEKDDVNSEQALQNTAAHYAKQLRHCIRKVLLGHDLAGLESTVRQRVESLPGQLEALTHAVVQQAQPMLKAGAMLRGIFFLPSDGAVSGADFIHSALSFRTEQLQRFGLSEAGGTVSKRELDHKAEKSQAVDGRLDRMSFLKHLLERELIQEASAAPISGTFRRRKEMDVKLITAFIASACIGLLSLFGYAYWQSGEVLDRMAGELNQLESRLAEHNTSAMSYSQVGPVLDRFHQLPIAISPDSGDVNVPWTLSLMRLDDALSSRLQFLYTRALEELLLPMVYFDLEELLRYAVDSAKKQNSAASDSSPDDFKSQLYSLLRTYMLPFESEHYRAERFDLWQQPFWKDNSDHLSPKLIQRLQPHFVQLSRHLHPPIALQQDEILIGQAREQLRGLSFEQRVLIQLQERAESEPLLDKDVKPIKVTEVAEPYAQAMLYRKSGEPLYTPLPAFYTQAGYKHLFKARLSEQVRLSALDTWVLTGHQKNEQVQPNLEDLEKRVTALYLSQYEKQWRALLDDVALKPLATGHKGLEQLEILSGDQSPMRKLLAKAAEETSLLSGGNSMLAALQGGAVKQPAGLSKLTHSVLQKTGLGSPSVTLPGGGGVVSTSAFGDLQDLFTEREDGSLPIDGLQGQIAKLHEEMNGLLNSSETIDPAKLEANKANQIIDGVEGDVPPYIESFVSSVADSANALASEDALGALTKQWSAEVLPMCKHVVNRRFPFFANERNQVSLVDFGLLFGYGGRIDQFFDQKLKGFADTSGRTWRWKKSQPFSKQSIRAFQLAQSIRNGFFQRGGQEPFVEFDIAAKRMDKRIKKMELRLGEQSLVYKWGPLRNKRFNWPVQGDYNQASLYIEAQGELAKPYYSVEGPWSWFKLLSEGQLQSLPKEGSHQLTLALNEHETAFVLNAYRVHNPFNVKALQNFRCPEVL